MSSLLLTLLVLLLWSCGSDLLLIFCCAGVVYGCHDLRAPAYDISLGRIWDGWSNGMEVSCTSCVIIGAAGAISGTGGAGGIK